MRIKILSSVKGLTLVELLLALSLIGVVSILIVGVLVSGINSYRSVNKQISLHDEANAIMMKFSNEIFVAIDAFPTESDSDKSITIEKYGNGEKSILEFKEDGTARINHVPINSALVTVLYDQSSITVNDEKGSVQIFLVIEDESGKSLKLTEEVTYVKVK